MAETDRETWAAMLRHLRTSSAGVCRQWFEEIEPMGMDRGVLRLRAHSNVHRDYLQRACAESFTEAAQAVTGRLLSVVFLGPEDDDGPLVQGSAGSTPPASAIEAKPRDGAGAAARRGDGLVLNPDYTFENFVVGPGNRFAQAAAVAVAGSPGRLYNPYFIHGAVGLGKTHLLQAICLRIRQARPDARIYYTSCEGFLTEFMDAVQAGEMAKFRHRFRDVDVLAVDDIHILAKRDRSQEEFFHTFNTLYQSHKQIILSSDAPPGEIPDLEERLVSRFKWGLVASVDRPGYDTRVAIIKNKARVRGLEITDEAACYIAERIDTNIRELEGAVAKMQVVAGVDHRPADLDLARQVMGDDAGARPERQVQIQSIVGAVADFYAVRLTDLQSKRRNRSVALPRQVCMYLARQHTRFSLAEIGGYFGGRDHTTVMHAVAAIKGRCDSDAEFAAVIRALGERARSLTSIPPAASGGNPA
jgi:chromosomal replication initiator protein